MISTARVIETRNQLAKSGTSGYTTEDEDNADLYAVQYEILGLLCDNYENNQKVSDALINHVRTLQIDTDITGVITITDSGAGASQSDGEYGLDDYYRTLTVLYDGLYPTTKINTNEIGMYQTSPIRRFDTAKNRAGYYFADGSINMLPAEAMEVTLIYCRKPTDAIIAYTSESDDDNDYQTIDEADTVDIEFPESLFNLFVYKMVERLGISMKEQVLFEYAQLGITKETKTEIIN